MSWDLLKAANYQAIPFTPKSHFTFNTPIGTCAITSNEKERQKSNKRKELEQPTMSHIADRSEQHDRTIIQLDSMSVIHYHTRLFMLRNVMTLVRYDDKVFDLSVKYAKDIEEEIQITKRSKIETKNMEHQTKLTKLINRKNCHKKLSAAAVKRAEEPADELEIDRKASLAKDKLLVKIQETKLS
jgi:hypothetical protein